LVIPPLIQSKLNLPSTRPTLVARRRLIDRLEAGWLGKISLISAPAGFGKTTLAVEWLRNKQLPVTWLSLDDSDNDPVRFLTYILAALQVIESQAGQDTLSLLQEPEPPNQELIATTLLNELTAIKQRFILAIDDYHLIQTLPIHQLLNTIVEHQPDQMHLVLLTREDPPLPLPRLRARGQITEIRQDDLRFSEEETAEFLGIVMNLGISKDDIVSLARRTEGWVAGLQLAALSIQGRTDQEQLIQKFTGSNRYILDYLVHEVYTKQPKEIQDFLLNTAILDRLSAPLCDAVAGCDESQGLLETMEKANLFIQPLDQSRTWYRYHRMFQDLLLNMVRARDKGKTTVLHQRASKWYENQDNLPDAIRHALAGEDWDRAFALAHRAFDAMVKRGEIYTLINWFSKIPDGLIQEKVEACLDFGWLLVLSGQFKKAALYLDRAEQLSLDNPAILGEVITAQAFQARAQGDPRRMVTLSQKALSLLPKEDQDSRCIVATNLVIAYWHSGNMNATEQVLGEVFETGEATNNQYAISTAIVFQGLVLAVRGRLHDAGARFEKVIQKENYPTFIRGLAYLYLGALHYEWNHLEASGRNLLEAIRLAERIQNDELRVSCWIIMSKIHMVNGNMAAASDLLDKADQMVVKGRVPKTAKPRLAAARLQHAISHGNLDAASHWAEHLVESCDEHPFYRFINITQARFLLAQSSHKEAADYLRGCFDQTSQAGWVFGSIAIRILQSLSAGDSEGALKFLVEAMEWAQPEGYIRTFVDSGAGVVTLLQKAIQRGVMPDYAAKVLSAMTAPDQKPTLGQLSLVEPLSPRELEVIQLMAAGLTNRQIADELVISTGTAKTHVHNICGKLGSHNRTEAVARAHELGLV
jgi:LuxR family maltose regulon positive regulatory protein